MTFEPAPDQSPPWVRASKIIATIGLVVLAVNLVGDGLQDALDPRALRARSL